jgi:hypothetical protein
MKIMTNNPFQLPQPVKIHFEATNTEDPVTFLSAFSEDAVVIDAGKEYRGKTAVKAWSEKVYFGDHLRLKITNAVQDAVEIVVTAKSDGDYDKTGLPDPLFLDFHFTVEGEKITRLRNVLSSNSRNIKLPEPVAAYYHACDVFDGTLLADCFAKDSLLVDEGQEYHGPQAVSEHILEANRNAKIKTDITACMAKNSITVVTATISGNFDGSPLPLDFIFTLNGDKIKALTIVSAGE